MGPRNWASGLIPLSRLHLRPLQRHFRSLGLTNRFTTPCRSDQSVLASLLRPHLWNPYPTFPGGVHGHLYTGLGRPYAGFPDFGYLDPFRQQAPYQRFGTQSGNFGPSSLGYSDKGPPSYDSYGQHYLVSYIYKQGGTHSPTLLRLVVDLVQ